MSISISSKVTNLSNLTDFIKEVSQIKEVDTTGLKEFLKGKVKNALEEVMNIRLTGGTTNDDMLNLYRQNNHIEDLDTKNGFGFRIFNNTTIEHPRTKHPDNYPYGFSIALAFEYGTGILGEQTPNLDGDSWKYNIHEYEDGWEYPTNDDFTDYEFTQGYVGFEVYRYLKDKVEKEINNWIVEYYDKEMK